MEKGYIVLTPEKIESMFLDLTIQIGFEVGYILPKQDMNNVRNILESQKQGLLKQLTK